MNVGNKIRMAQERKIPYMLIMGDRDIEAGNVSVRLRDGQDLGAMPVKTFIEKFTGFVTDRSLALWD